jgi:hypothetical protein
MLYFAGQATTCLGIWLQSPVTWMTQKN